MGFDYFLSIIVLADIIFVGFLITYFFRLNFFWEAKIAAGALIGMALFGSVMLFISYFLGLNLLGLIIFLFVINAIGFKLLTKENIRNISYDFLSFRQRLRQWQWKLFLFFIGLFIILFGFLISQLLTFNKDRYFVQPVHSYGDISLHLGIISSLAFSDNFPIKNPILAEEKISYPFLIDFITAIFVNPLSLRLDQAVALTGVLLMSAFIIILAYFALRVTGNKLAACLVLVLFFFNGGLGFFYFFADLQNSHLGFLSLITNLTKDYTALKEFGFYWINVVLSMLLPQRSFLLGLPISILILSIFWDLSEQFDKRKFILGSLLVALLPIIHAHSLIALVPFLLWFSVPFLKDKKRIIFILVVGLFVMTIILFLSKLFLQQSENPFSLMQYKFGWMAPKGKAALFYLNNFGFNLLLIPIVLFFGLIKKLKIAYFALIGQVWFILPSLFLFQPWDFDNTKIFIYWYLASVFLLGYFLSKLILSKEVTSIILVLTAVYLLNFAAFLDITRLVLSSGTRFEIYSPQAIKLSEFVKENVKKDATFLAVDKFDNPVVTLAGRKVVLGYHGWLWTYGLNFSQKEADVRSMLAGRASLDLFKKYNITHVVFFDEKHYYEINKKYFERFKRIYSSDGSEIFEL